MLMSTCIEKGRGGGRLESGRTFLLGYVTLSLYFNFDCNN